MWQILCWSALALFITYPYTRKILQFSTQERCTCGRQAWQVSIANAADLLTSICTCVLVQVSCTMAMHTILLASTDISVSVTALRLCASLTRSEPCAPCMQLWQDSKLCPTSPNSCQSLNSRVPFAEEFTESHFRSSNWQGLHQGWGFRWWSLTW